MKLEKSILKNASKKSTTKALKKRVEKRQAHEKEELKLYETIKNLPPIEDDGFRDFDHNFSIPLHFNTLTQEEIVEKVIAIDKGLLIVKYNLGKFDESVHPYIADKLIEAGEFDLLARYLKYFDLDENEILSRIVKKYIEHDKIDTVLKHITHFTKGGESGQRPIIHEIIESGNLDIVAEHFKKIAFHLYQEILEVFMDHERYDLLIQCIKYGRDEYGFFDKITEKLIEKEKFDALLQYVSQSDHQHFPYEFITVKSTDILIERVPELNKQMQTSIALGLIKHNWGHVVFKGRYMDQSSRFNKLEPEEIVKSAFQIAENSGYHTQTLASLASALEDFNSALQDYIVGTFMKQGRTDILIQNLNYSSRLNLKVLGERIIQHDSKAVPKFLEKITGVASNEVKEYLTEMIDKLITIKKEEATDTGLPFSERRDAFDVLAGLAVSCESGLSLLNDFTKIIITRSKQKEVSDSKYGLDPIQEAAFYTLMRMDNKDANEALFHLIAADTVHPTVKYAVLKKFLRKKNDHTFFSAEVKKHLHTWLLSSSAREESALKKNKSTEHIDWRDLQFVEAMQKIPSKELRDTSLRSLSMFEKINFTTFPLYETWHQEYRDIPKNIFMQTVKFCHICDDMDMLNRFQEIFSNVRENRKKEALLYGISHILDNSQIVRMLGRKMQEDGIQLSQNSDALAVSLQNLIFLNKIGKAEKVPEEIFMIAEGLDDIVSLTEEIVIESFQEILPDERLTEEKIISIKRLWNDNLEPIFTYTGRFSGLRKYIAEIVSNMDNWKTWRYAEERGEEIKNQIGHLSEEQAEIWKNDAFLKYGEVTIEQNSDKPERIREYVHDAVLLDKHISGTEAGQDHRFIQKTLERALEKIAKEQNRREEIVSEVIQEVESDANRIDAVTQYNQKEITWLEDSISMITDEAEITFSKKKEKTVKFIISNLSGDLQRILSDRYTALKSQSVTTLFAQEETELRQEISQALMEKKDILKQNFQETLESDIWERLHLDKNNIKNIKQFQQKRQELKTTIDLLRLLNLSHEHIITNKIIEKDHSKKGEMITTTLSRLKKYFKKGHPFFQDIENIESVIKEGSMIDEKGDYAMIFTDNPQMLWEVGKYPLGCGSCQHYAQGSHAKNLMGYVGDPNCKVTYIINLKKLPRDMIDAIHEQGFEAVKDSIPTENILEAAVSRSLFKIGKDTSGTPVVILERTYGNKDMNEHINNFADTVLAKPMGIRMIRGGGDEAFTTGHEHSLSPYGQYEDFKGNGHEVVIEEDSSVTEES